jgi:membrane fusion protein (multidrug efflux system)
MKRTLITLITACFFLLPAMALTEESAPGIKMQARGIIIAKQQPVISSEIAARVERVPLHDGEYFKKGDLLLSFNSELLSAQKDKAKAELDAAMLKLENSRQLEQLKAIGTLEVSLAEVEVKRRRAEMKITDIALSRCLIRAPFNGRVVARHIDEHESVAPNQKLLDIVSTDQVEIEVMGPSKWLTWLSPGQSFSVRIDALSFETEAKVISVGAVVDPVSGMVKFHGQLVKTTTNLLPGMMATVVLTGR